MTRWCAASPAAEASAALKERFAAELARLLPPGARLGLAVSGGPDSMALLLLTEAVLGSGFEVVTIDHALRPEAAAEAQFVADLCGERGVGCTLIRVALAPGNVQHRAREARYRAFAAWARERGIAAIATAHHADDQAETLLMRLNRGSGVAGLAGVRERRVLAEDGDCLVIRPLLGFRRAELRLLVEAAGVPFVEDPSNRDRRFGRVQMRARLAESGWLDPRALARSAAHLGEAYEALQDYARLLWPQRVEQQGDGFVLSPGPSREMNRRLLAMAMERLGGRPRGGDVARLLARLEAGEGGNLAGVLATPEGGRWRLRPEPPRRGDSGDSDGA